MKKSLLILVFAIGVSYWGWGQILTFEFSALAGSEVSALSNSNDVNLTSSTITRGAGLIAAANAQRFNATDWALSSIANAVSGNDYMEFTITPNSGYQFTVSSVVVQWQRSSTGNTAIALRSSIDSYAADLDAVKNVVDNTSTQTFTWTFSQANSSTPVTYRFYSYAEATGGTGGPGDGTGDDIIVYGTTTPFGGNPTVATPTFNPVGGSYFTTQNVTIACTTGGAEIYYTTDGTDPDGTDTEYTEAIPISSTTIVRAIAYASGYDPSAIATAIYTFPVEVSDIATLRTGLTNGTLYKLISEAVLTFQTENRNSKYIQDATGAILIDDQPGNITTTYNLYDGITGIIGSLTYYSNMLQFVPVTDPGAATSIGNTVTPIEVSLSNLTTDYQGKLVKILNTTITGTGNFVESTNYTITDGSSKGTGVLRTAYTDLDYIGTPIPQVAQDLTGVVLQFSSTMQLVPRSLSDFAIAPVPLSVTFYVDMTNEVGTFTTVDVAGDFNGWGSPGDVMTLVSDNIYSYTTSAIFDPDDVLAFKFRKDGTWDTSEPGGNRTYTVIAGVNNYYAVYGVMVAAEIGWANLQWPPSGEIDLGGNYDVYAQVYAVGLTGTQGNIPNLDAWIGYNSENTNPNTWNNWVTASYGQDYGNNEEWVANIGSAITSAGTYYYASRFKLGFDDYVYGGYSEGGGGFWDGSSYVSGILTVNTAQPNNHVTDFNATSNSYSAVNVTWSDSDAEGYLIKGSDVSFEAITAPQDGTPESNGGLVMNVAVGIESHQYNGLSASTQYFFKIFPFNGAAGAINYKTDGIIPEATTTTEATPSYQAGDFGFTASSGNWNVLANWKQWDGTGWNTTPSNFPTTNDNVYILNGKTAIVEASGKNAKNLIVEAGAKLFTNNTTMGTPRYINVVGNISCDGTIGNGSGNNDVLSFNINGTNCIISGNGSFTANRMRKNATGNTTLHVNMDVELRYNGDALYNSQTNSNVFDITVGSNVHLNCSGNGTLPTGGILLKENDKLTIAGNITVSGVLSNLAGTNGILIKSDATGTGSLIENNGVSATVERYLTEDKWHYVSAPVDDPTANVFFGMYMMRWNEPSGLWSYIVDPAYVLSNDMEGFAIWSNNNATSVFTGQLNTGAKSIDATAVGPFAHNGYNFFGNPYPSSLDWNVNDGSGWSRTAGNIEPTLYIWNHTYLNYGVYVKDGATGTLDVDNIIPPHQGFFVHCSEASGSLGVNNGARIHASKDILKSGASVSDLLKLKVEGNTYADEIILQIDPMGSVNAGMFDALKFHGDIAAPQLYSLSKDGKELSINSFPESEDYNVIPVGMEAGVDAIYTLSISDLIGFASGNLYLEDVKEGTFTKLDDNMIYTFTAGPNDDPMRFLLHLNGQLAVPENIQGLSDVKVYSFAQDVYVVSENGLNGTTVIYDLLGREILREKLNGEIMKKFDLTGHNGYMIVRVTTEKGSLNQKVYLR
jgi:hypothetical protein